MTITEWRNRRYRAMRILLARKVEKREALRQVEVIWPLDDDVVCDCGRQPSVQSEPIVWFNTHGHQCEAVNKAGGYFSYWTEETA